MSKKGNKKAKPEKQYLASAGFVIFNAAVFYEILRPQFNLHSVEHLRSQERSIRLAMMKAFEAARKLSYSRIFVPAINVLKLLPSHPAIESSLRKIFDAASAAVANAWPLRHDLTGRIYHSLLGLQTAKIYATYYTSIPAAQMLAWLSIESYRAKVCDFACGSGTLIVAAYHRKLALAFSSGYVGTVSELHRLFIENDIWAFDAMPFASHLAMVNVALQQPEITFSGTKIYHIPVIAGRLGSLDLLKSNKMQVAPDVQGVNRGPVEQAMEVKSVQEIEVPNDFDLVVMNPPFTRKERAVKLLNWSQTIALAKKQAQKVGVTFKELEEAGIAAPFVLLGHSYLKEGGRLALVLPTTMLSKISWQGIRELFWKYYHVEYVFLNWAPGKPAFSEGSTLRDCLLIAKKTPEKKPYTFVVHLERHLDPLQAREIAEKIREVRNYAERNKVAPFTEFRLELKVWDVQTKKPKLENFGSVVTYPWGLFGKSLTNWYRFVGFRNVELARAVLSAEGLL